MGTLKKIYDEYEALKDSMVGKTPEECETLMYEYKQRIDALLSMSICDSTYRMKSLSRYNSPEPKPSSATSTKRKG